MQCEAGGVTPIPFTCLHAPGSYEKTVRSRPAEGAGFRQRIAKYPPQVILRDTLLKNHGPGTGVQGVKAEAYEHEQTDYAELACMLVSCSAVVDGDFLDHA